MKRLRVTLAVLALFLTVCVQPQEAQEQHKVYLPFVAGEGYRMGDWYVVIPEATTTLVTNPSIETGTTGWATGGVNTIARSSTQSKYGAYSLLATYQNHADLAYFGITCTGATPHTFSLWVYIPTNYDGTRLQLTAENYAGATGELSVDYDMTIRDDWQRADLTFTPNAGDLAGFLVCQEGGVAPTAGRFIYVDAAQAESLSYVTTYCDGDQEGCEWAGAAHASTSSRSALSRAGGRVRDFADLYFRVSRMDGPGMPPQEPGLQQYAILPGGEMTNIREASLAFTLTGVIYDESFTSINDVHEAREDLIEILRPNSYPYVDGQPQPVLIRYRGADTEKEIAAHYETGLELRIDARIPCWERVAFRFIADDPFWREIGESADILDTEDAATFRIVAARLRSTGQWDDLGPPNALGTYTQIRAIARAEDGTIYFGGNFLNFDNIANADYIVSYDPVAGTYSALGTGTNGIVRAIAIGSDGLVYVGGQFAAAGGVANTDGIAVWDPVATAWSALATGVDNNAVFALTVGLDGHIFAGGSFTLMSGVANTVRLAEWDPIGAAWSALSTGANNTVLSLETAQTGNIFVGGDLTTAGGVAVNRIAEWDGSAFTALGTGLNSSCNALAINTRGLLFAGGNFTTAGGNTANRVAQWNGTGWSALGSGANDVVDSLIVGPDDILYMGGQFTTVGGLNTLNGGAKWNGASWAYFDCNLPGKVDIYALEVGPPDPVITANYDLWIGFSTTGAATLAGTVDVTNAGTAEAFPVIVFERSGGTTAVITQIRNETLGLDLLFDYSLSDGETLTVDLSPEIKNVVSSAYGRVPGAILPNSDFGTWRLNPGTNQVTAFVDVTGAPTITAYLTYRTTWAGLDD